MPSTTLIPESPGPRLIAVPGAWPPYDCETHGATCPALGDPGSHADGRSPGADVAGVRPGGEPPNPVAAGGGSGAPDRARPEAAAGGGPDAPAVAAGVTAAWHRQFAQVIIEILAGSRPPRQIAGWTTERVRGRIDALSRMLAPDHRPRIRRVMTSRPSALVVEMTVVVGLGPRSRALAMRFEHMPGRPAAPGLPPRPARWLCTELEAL